MEIKIKESEKTSMKIGCRAHDYGRYSAKELAAVLHEKGYHACQLAMPKALAGISDYQDVTAQDAALIGKAFAKQGVEISVLGCYMDLSSPDKEVRLAAVENVAHSLSLQKPMGAKCVASESSYENLDGQEREKEYRFLLLVDSVKRIMEAAAKYDGVFAIEPVFWYPLDTAERMQILMEQAGDAARLKMIFDPANVLKKKDQASQGRVWENWLTEFGENIIAMHIKDFILEGDRYCPKPLGSGIMDYGYIRKWLCENRPDMPLLREEVQLLQDEADIRFMRGLVCPV